MDEEILSSNFEIIYPCSLYHIMRSGAVQEVNGRFNAEDVGEIVGSVYKIALPAANNVGYVRLTIDEDLAILIDWEKVRSLIDSKLENGEYYNEESSIFEILKELNIATAQQIFTGTVINGQPMMQTQLDINEPYRMVYHIVTEPPVVVEML